ncbi:hypothetical protein EYC84_009832 [Monilinia fructicola]|uniref:Uncharacterized protein n=1 Tax=Monilinia fructicola TaxID=38448 RepID=A0A5M9JBQ9_MONFR|nr:hypothetical protein EYC84_009832 [Monilinia fructicola]
MQHFFENIQCLNVVSAESESQRVLPRKKRHKNPNCRKGALLAQVHGGGMGGGQHTWRCEKTPTTFFEVGQGLAYTQMDINSYQLPPRRDQIIKSLHYHPEHTTGISLLKKKFRIKPLTQAPRR